MGLCLFLILVSFFSGPLLILPLHCPPCSPRQCLSSSLLFSCWGHDIQAQGFRDPLDIDGSLISVSTPGPTGEALESHINGAFFSLAVQTGQDQHPHCPTLHLCSPLPYRWGKESRALLSLSWPPTSNLPASCTGSPLNYLSHSSFSPLLPQGNIQHPDEYSPFSQRNRVFCLDPLLPPSSCPSPPSQRSCGGKGTSPSLSSVPTLVSLEPRTVLEEASLRPPIFRIP